MREIWRSTLDFIASMSSALATADDIAYAGDEPACYILSIDVGTTSIRCHIYNKQAKIVAESAEPLVLSYPEPCAVELDPEQLWKKFVAVVKNALYGK